MNPEPWQDDFPCMEGQTWVITGAAGDLGQAACEAFLALGADLCVTARSYDRAKALADSLRARFPHAHIQPGELNLSSMASVRRFADSWDGPIDGLVHNAGVCFVPRSFTEDGYELKYQTHCLAPMVLNRLLEPCLAGGRVVAVNSLAAMLAPLENDWRGCGTMRELARYGRSKRLMTDAMLTWGRENHGISCVLTHPGIASTAMVKSASLSPALLRLIPSLFMDPGEACKMLVYAATTPLAGGAQVAPGGFLQIHGRPRLVSPRPFSGSSPEHFGERVLADAEKFL